MWQKEDISVKILVLQECLYVLVVPLRSHNFEPQAKWSGDKPQVKLRMDIPKLRLYSMIE